MRTIFNNIISNKNLEPKPNTEYIYNLDFAWINHSEIVLKKGLIVENVEQTDNGSYTFNFKGENPKYKYECSYGWAFIENIESNIELLKEIEHEENILNIQKTKLYNLRNNLIRLYSEEIDCKMEK